jgi:membrane protein
VAREIVEDQGFGHTAELAFFLILALFPLLICILTFLTFIPESRALALKYLAEVMPSEAMALVRSWVNELFEQRNSAVFSFGLLFTLWSASTGMTALMEVLNVAYDVREQRSFLKQRLVSLALTIALALLILVGCGLVIYGGKILISLMTQLTKLTLYYWVGRITSFLFGFLLVFAGLQLTYNFAPDVDRRANRTWPGSLFGTIGIFVFSYLFSVYLRYAPSYSTIYGSLGAVVILMIWLYLVGLIIMIGAEINSELMKDSVQRRAAA